MAASQYIIRNFRPSDFEQCRRLLAEVGGGDSGPSMLCLNFADRLHRPGCSPENDVLVAEAAGEVVGCLEMTPEPGIGRLVLDFRVKPEHRRRGISRQFLDRSAPRAQALGISHLHACIDETDELAKMVLSRFGFRSVRRFLEMSFDFGSFSALAASSCRQMQAGEEEKLLRLQNRSFQESWGYHPNTLEQITYHLGVGASSPEDVRLCYLDDKLAGYCWTILLEAGDIPRGRIFMLGVAPEFRGKGVGRRALAAGLGYLRSKGVTEIVLTVDSENGPALSLYRTAGFTVSSSSLWYEEIVA